MNGQQINPPEGFEKLVHQGFNLVNNLLNQNNSENNTKD